MAMKLGTLIYCLCRDRVLLMHRRKEPNRGLWVAPGGKVEPGESPYECARRELREETGLEAAKLHFRGMTTLVSPLPEWRWLLFIYAAEICDGDVVSDDREGLLRWWPLAQVSELAIPRADAVFFPHIVDFSQPFYQAKFIYDADLQLQEVLEYPV